MQVKGKFIIDNAVNALIICVLGYLAYSVYVIRANNNRSGVPPIGQVNPSVLLAGVNKSAELNLIIAVSPSCHFCRESAPFYKSAAR